MLEIESLKVWFPIRRGIFPRLVGHVRAVDGVSLSIPAGQTLGLVGESGCGKTTLGRAILGLQKVSSGRVIFQGTELTSLRGKALRQMRRNLQMVFQDPFSSLNPRMSVQELITEGLLEHGLLGGESRDEAAARLMLEVGLDPASRYRFPHEFSGGQRQRICIARALALQPRFVVCDEPVSALDVSVQAQILNLLIELREKHQLGYLFISHDLSVVRLISQRIAVMYLGRLVEYGDSQDVMETPLHPYTQTLVAAIPVPGKDRTRAASAAWREFPAAGKKHEGCSFLPRCPLAKPICAREKPALLDIQGRKVACHCLAGEA